MIEELNKLFSFYIGDEYSEFIELISIKKIKDVKFTFEVNWFAKITYSNKERDVRGDIKWFGSRMDIQPIIRELKLQILTGNNQNKFIAMQIQCTDRYDLCFEIKMMFNFLRQKV